VGPFARYECNDLDSEPDNYLSKSLLVYAMEELKATAGPLGFEGLAAMHHNQSTFNGYNSGPNGFGVRQQAGFATWHRPFLWQFERALFTAARTAAQKFTNPDIKEHMFNIESYYIRLCYWDWTQDSFNAFVSPDDVEVLPFTASQSNDVSTRPNPFKGFNGLSGTYASALPTTRNAEFLKDGLNFTWYEPYVLDFLTSGERECTYVSGKSSCTANLEEIYDWVREDVGGTIYNPATASFDPLFYFHHSMVDFLLWLWQINFPDEADRLFIATPQYVPFKNDTSDAGAFGPEAIFDPENLDYYYEQSSTGTLWHDGEEGDGSDPEEGGGRRLLVAGGGVEGACQQRKHRRRLVQQQRQRQLLQEADDATAVAGQGATGATAGAAVSEESVAAPKLGHRKKQQKPGSADPKSAAAQASLRDFVHRLQKEYSGYRYQARLLEVDCRAEQEPWVIVALLKSNVSAGTAASADWRSLREQQNACAVWSAQSCKQGAGKASVNLDLTNCLKRNGRNPDQAPKDAAHPENGPAAVPVSLEDVEFRALLRDQAVDVTEKVGVLKLSTAITWTWLFDQQGATGEQHGKKGSTDGGAIAAAAAAQGVTAVPVSLYVTSVVAGAGGVPTVEEAQSRPALFGRSGGVVEYEAGGSRKRLL